MLQYASPCDCHVFESFTTCSLHDTSSLGQLESTKMNNCVMRWWRSLMFEHQSQPQIFADFWILRTDSAWFCHLVPIFAPYILFTSPVRASTEKSVSTAAWWWAPAIQSKSARVSSSQWVGLLLDVSQSQSQGTPQIEAEMRDSNITARWYITIFHSSQCLQDFIERSGSTRSSFSSRLFRRSKDCCFTWQNRPSRQTNRVRLAISPNADMKCGISAFPTKGQSIPIAIGPLKLSWSHTMRFPQTFLFQKKLGSSLCRCACLFSSARSLPRTANSLTVLCSFASSRRALPWKSDKATSVSERKKFRKGWVIYVIWSRYHSISFSFVDFWVLFGCFLLRRSLRMAGNEQNKSKSKMPSFSLAASSSRRKVWRSKAQNATELAGQSLHSLLDHASDKENADGKPNLIGLNWSKTLSFLASTLSLMPDRPLLRSCR